MPVISMFYGIIVHMFNEKGVRHQKPHVHCTYGEFEAVFDFEGNALEGELPNGKSRLMQAWIELHKEELFTNWALLQNGDRPFRISPIV